MNETIIQNDAQGPVVTTEPAIRIAAVLNRSFSTFFRNFVPFIVLAILLTSPSIVLQWLVTIDMQPKNVSLHHIISFVVIILISWLLLCFLSGTLVYGAFVYLRGNRASLSASISQGLRALFPVVIVTIISSILMLLGLIALVIPGIVITLMFFVTVPVTVVERRGIIDSLKRSVELTKGNRWRIFGLLIVIVLIYLPIQIAVTMVLGFSVGFIPTDTSGNLIHLGAQFILGAVGTAFFMVVNAVTYHDLRVVKEGLNSEQLSTVFD